MPDILAADVEAVGLGIHAGIAREAGLSRFHTLRLFNRAYGETPARRVARLRMERAKDLLATGEEPITEIAFRRWAGLSAREYRNQRGRPAHR